MKKVCLLITAGIILFTGCAKKNDTYYLKYITPIPPFVVSGVHDLNITKGFSSGPGAETDIIVAYGDSAQQNVVLSLSALPEGITMDTLAWITHGVPSFESYIYLYDTSFGGAVPGNYPMTLTATGSVSGTKTFTFNLRVLPEQSCTSNIVGIYNNCFSCTSFTYKDTVYADATVANKIWFKNFDNSGKLVFAMYNCASNQLTIPNQAFGGTTISGNGSASGSASFHNMNIAIPAAGGGTCTFNMN